MNKEELINGYLEGSLSESQLTEFEGLLETDVEFRSAYEFEKELQLGLKKEERQELKALFSSLDTKNQTTEKKKEGKVISMRPWLMAASIALVVGLGSWMFFFNSPDLNSEQLYSANFEPYANVIHPIERGNQLEDLKSKAFTAYENEEYLESLALFRELYEKQNDSYIDFYSANILMQLDRHEEAIPFLEGYISKNGELKDRATWYLALANLKLDNISASKAELKKLIEMGSFKIDAAKELLDQLD